MKNWPFVPDDFDESFVFPQRFNEQTGRRWFNSITSDYILIVHHDIEILTTIAINSKIFRHLDSFDIWFCHKIPSNSDPLTMTTKNRLNCFILFHRSYDPTGIVLMTMHNQFMWDSIDFGKDFSRSRMWSIMSTEFLKKSNRFRCLKCLWRRKIIQIHLQRFHHRSQSMTNQLVSSNPPDVIDFWLLNHG